MDDGVTSFLKLPIMLPLFVAVVGWYFASRIAVVAISRGRESPIRRAAAQCVPLFILVLIAIARHQPDIAIGAVFGACVATISLAVGVVTFTSPPASISSEAVRKWAMILPTAILVFLAGYQSRFTWLHVMVLAIQGIVLLLVWGQSPNLVHAASIHLSEHERRISARVTGLLLLLTLAISIGAGWLAVSGSVKLLERSSLPSMSIIASLLLGPALVVPMIGTSCALSARGQYAHAIDSLVGFVMLSLCAILPILITAWHLGHVIHAKDLQMAWQSVGDGDNTAPLIFPLVIWRVDCVMLLILGVAFLPFSTGRWRPGRAEGVFLILLYVAYMILWRWAAMLN